MTNKEQYIQFCQQHADICIYSQPWWLDAVVGDGWDVVLVWRDGRIVASFPYAIKHYPLGVNVIWMPHLTQKLGPYIVYPPQMSEMKRIGFEHEIYSEIIDHLPRFSQFIVNFDQRFKNWLAFYWRGFSQTTKYSYRLYGIKDHKAILDGYNRHKVQKIRKAQGLTLKFDLDFNAFYSYIEDAISERGDKVEFSRELFVNLCRAIYSNNKGRILYCVDSNDNIHAVDLVIWDGGVAYYLMAMRKKEYSTSGGTEFLVDETIKYVSQYVDVFDFEGSMMPGVEEAYRWYGSSQTEYYCIYKNNSVLLSMYQNLKKALGRKRS